MSHWDFLTQKLGNDIVRYCIQPLNLPDISVVKHHFNRCMKQVAQVQLRWFENELVKIEALFPMLRVRIIKWDVLMEHDMQRRVPIENAIKKAVNKVDFYGRLMLKQRLANQLNPIWKSLHYECECGSWVSYKNAANHPRTKQHSKNTRRWV